MENGGPQLDFNIFATPAQQAAHFAGRTPCSIGGPIQRTKKLFAFEPLLFGGLGGRCRLGAPLPLAPWRCRLRYQTAIASMTSRIGNWTAPPRQVLAAYYERRAFRN